MRHNPSAGKYNGGPRGGSERATLCISSQVGCQMGCTFCATGTMGLVGQLAAGEIVEQLVHARKLTPIRNIVFMVCHGVQVSCAGWHTEGLSCRGWRAGHGGAAEQL